MSDYAQYFDETGRCLLAGDPYRDEDCDQRKILFDEEGCLKYEVFQWLREFLKKPSVSALSDAAAMYHADVFAGHTKGNYTTIYYWR